MVAATDDDSDVRLQRLEQRLQQMQEFIEDGIADPWDDLEERTLPAIGQRIASLADRVAALEHRLTRLEGSA